MAKDEQTRERALGEDRRLAAGARQGPTGVQWLAGVTVMTALAAGLIWAPQPALQVLHHLLFAVFTCGVALRWAALLTPSAHPTALPCAEAELPRYTVIAPMYDEAEVAADLVANLSRLDYPRDRLQVLIALEADDLVTREAVLAAGLSPHMEVVLAPDDGPRTKPRACNVALAHATGDLVVVYDAEDAPHPGQLREAAARFATGPERLACLQAPLRIVPPARGAVGRQFGLEYAALFEVMLPACARWRLPFPLGGTSNHFRRAALQAVGGWDAYNVTEDADAGFRLAAAGYRVGVLTLPTRETPPDGEAWLPQRARWVKGYMQTWGVHMRSPWTGGWSRFASLQLTLGYAIVSAVLHGPLALIMAVSGAAALWRVSGGPSHPLVDAPVDLALCLTGWSTAVLCMAVGARRAGLRMRPHDALLALAYWPMQSIAAAVSLQQLVARPFHWDKTRHRTAASNAPLAEEA